MKTLKKRMLLLVAVAAVSYPLYSSYAQGDGAAEALDEAIKTAESTPALAAPSVVPPSDIIPINDPRLKLSRITPTSRPQAARMARSIKMERIHADLDRGLPDRFVTPDTGAFIKNFSFNIVQGKDNKDHLALKGWIPSECVLNVQIRAGENSSFFDRSRKAYPIFIEGVAVAITEPNDDDKNGDGIITPEECLSKHPADSCNQTTNRSMQNCTPLAELESVQAILAKPLTESGSIVLRVDRDNADFDEIGNIIGVKGDDFLPLAYTSPVDLMRAENQQRFMALCEQARSGSPDALSSLQELYPEAADIVSRIKEENRNKAVTEIFGSKVRDLASAQEKFEAIAGSSESLLDQYPELEGEVIAGIHALGREIKELEAGEEEDEYKFEKRKNKLLTEIYSKAKSLGDTTAKMRLAYLDADRLELAMANPSYNLDNYAKEKKAFAKKYNREAAKIRKKAIAEGKSDADEKPYTDLMLRSETLLGQQADMIARARWQERANSGEFRELGQGGSYGGLNGYFPQYQYNMPYMGY